MNNMIDTEWILRRLSEASILAYPEHVSLEAVCRIVAALRQNLNYDPDKISPDEVVLLIQKLAKGQQ
jgi:hypothetical protein